ncbi:MAG TPA: hypothetical protein VGK67_00430 [Myxococcales bacterium]|jgi:hypothetical protein
MRGSKPAAHAGLALLALLVPAAALAFVMSAGTVLHRTAKHREDMDLTSLVVRGQFTFTGADASAAAAALKVADVSRLVAEGVLTYRMPGRCKIEVGPSSATFVNGNVKVAGPAIPALKSLASDLCPLIAQPSGDELVTFLRGRGVDTTSATLGRVGGTVCYLVGGKPRDVGVPSIWIEKERLDPLRLVVKEGAAVEDLRMIDYSSPLAGEWHPRIVELRRGEELVARFVADSLETNGKIPDGTF